MLVAAGVSKSYADLVAKLKNGQGDVNGSGGVKRKDPAPRS